MSFSAIPQQPAGEPPRVRIDVGTDDPALSFTTLMIYRDGKPIREQPYAGGSEAVAFDYEAPFGVPATYSAVGTVATHTAVHTETWSSLSGWTTLSGTPSVSGSHFSGGSVERALTFPAAGRISSQGLITGAAAGKQCTLTFGRITVNAYRAPGGNTYESVFYGGASIAVQGLQSPFAINWDTTSATIVTTVGTYTVSPSGLTAYPLKAEATPGAPASYVEDFVISVPENVPFAPPSLTVTAAFQGTWLIHPTRPSLSCQIDSGPTSTDHSLRFVEASSGQSKTSRAVRTVHRPPGRRKAVVHTSGPREADDWTLVIGAPTIEAKNAIRAIIDDQTSLLLRSRVDAGWDLPDGWYSVGDVDFSRLEKPVANESVLIPLPLTPVDEPIVRQGALWTWGGVLMRYPTWRDLLDDNETWLDVLAGS